MLAINTETEKRYTAVADGLTDMGYQPQTGVMIAANIMGYGDKEIGEILDIMKD